MFTLITAAPEILGGKPCIKGTRLSVEFILNYLPAAQQEMRYWLLIRNCPLSL